MTENEKQEIVAAVIQSLKTNGRTIMQLTEATSVTDSDYFEIHGGRRIAYSHLYENLLNETTDIIDAYKTDIANLVAGKLDYYKVDWTTNPATRTVENFNAYASAIQAFKTIVVNGQIINATYDPVNKIIHEWYYTYSCAQTEREITLTNGEVIVGRYRSVAFANITSVTALGNRLDADIATINNRIDVQAGEITNLNATVNEHDIRMDGIEDDIEDLAAAVAGNREAFLTQEEYNALVDAGTIDPNTKYYIYEE